MALLEICLKVSYFQFRGEFYELEDGLAMGSPISAVVANIYMSAWEESALASFRGRKQKVWWRFVNDIFSVVKRTPVRMLLEHLNTQHPSTQVTLQLEEGQVGPFVDLNVRRQASHLETTVYRQQTHTKHYLQFDSHHPMAAKKSVVSSLLHLVQYISTGAQREDEKKTQPY